MRATEFVAEKIIHENKCPRCGGVAVSDPVLAEKQDACYHKVKSRYKIWPSAYASGALVQCRKKGAANWGNKSKNESQALTELTGYGADKKYQALDSYKRYDIYVSRKKFNNLYFIAVAENPRTLQAKFKAKGDTPNEALKNLQNAIDQEIETAPKVSGQATLDFNVDFVRDILEGDSGVFYAKIVAGPKLVLAGPDMLEYPEIMRDEGFKPSTIRTYKGGEGTTKLPAVPLSSKAAAAANVIANGRYVLGPESRDKDGNRVFDLEFDSVVSAANEKMRLKTPAVTVGTLRSSAVGEASYADRRSADSELRKMFAPSAAFRSGDRVQGKFSDSTETVVGVITKFDPKTNRAVVQDAQGRKFFVHAQNLAKIKDRSLSEQQVNEGLKEKAAAIVMSLGLLGPMAAQNAQAFDLGDVARALPMVVGVVNQNRGLDDRDVLRRIVTQEINQYRAEERQFDRWFAHQLRDPRDRDAFRLAVQEKEFWQARAMNMRSGNDAAKAAAAVTYYQTVRNNLAEKYGITVPR